MYPWIRGDHHYTKVSAKRGPRDADVLTPRQYAVLEELARGSTNKPIAHVLSIEEITVKAHISAISRKLHVKNRWQAVVASRSLVESAWE